MGNKQCCVYRGSKSKRDDDVYRQAIHTHGAGHGVQFDDVVITDDKSFSSQTGVRHISERENFPEGEFTVIVKLLVQPIIVIFYPGQLDQVSSAWSLW